MRAAGKAQLVTTLTFPTSGHMICGNPEYPIYAYGKQSADPNAKVLVDEGAAAVKASRTTLEFLAKVLR